jgi:hypothetical protein
MRWHEGTCWWVRCGRVLDTCVFGCASTYVLVCKKKKGVNTVTAQTERDKLQTTHEMSLIDRLVLCFERRSSSTDFQ